MAGIACAGHWVIDLIKFIDHWPSISELSNIESTIMSNGGAPFNIIADLANLKLDIPTYGIGCIGDDCYGQRVLTICRNRNINTRFLNILPGTTTSYTDVMTLMGSGTRTMFHYRGVNKLFSPKHVPIDILKKEKVKLFYLGHLLLMDAMETPDTEYGLSVCRLLHDVREAGMETVVDIATESADRYEKIVLPTLPYIDHFVINELEAQKTAKIQIRKSDGSFSLDAVKKAARFLLDHGVQKSVVIHMLEGAYAENKKGEKMWAPSLMLPPEAFNSTCGAGDAFCAGVLVGLHENWSMEKTLHTATAIAAISITSPYNSDGILPLADTLKATEAFPRRGKIEEN